MKTNHVYTIYQIRLSQDEVDTINHAGHLAVPKQKARLDIGIAGYEIGNVAGEAWCAGHFKRVAQIIAADLEDVFKVGNCGPENRIAREAPMASISVGDIIAGPDREDHQGEPVPGLHVVAQFGFEPAARRSSGGGVIQTITSPGIDWTA